MQRSKVSAKLNFQVAFYFILFPHVAEAAFHVDWRSDTGAPPYVNEAI